MQTTSLAGRLDILSHEGLILTRYKDSVGVWTLGAGHTAAAGSPNPKTYLSQLTVKEALDLFAVDVQKYEKRVRKAFGREVPQHQFDAATSFDYNTGGIHKATWVKKFNQGDMAAAKKSFMQWRRPPEIVPRRKKERDLFFEGMYSNNGHVTVYKATPQGKVLWGTADRVKVNLNRSGDAPMPPKSPPVKKQDKLFAMFFEMILRLFGRKS